MNTTDTQREWLTVRQAALYLQVHRQTIMHYLRDGVITSSRLTPKGPHRIKATTLERLLKPRRKKGN